MIHEIENLIDEKMKIFLNEISNDYSIDKNDLNKKWQIFINRNTTQFDAKKSKKSAYQNFFAFKRMEFKGNDSSLSFGELSRKISQEWNKLNDDEKNKYIDKTPSICKHKFSFEELNQKKMSELKELCENIGIKKSGNKQDLIKNLLGQSNSNHKDTVPSTKKILKNESDIEKTDVADNSFEIYVSTNDQKRSDIETSEIERINEDEFLFDDDDDIESEEYESDSSEKTIEDDDPFDG